jgi:prepilin-type N-terminal cleavage/methylation domain-containing protein
MKKSFTLIELIIVIVIIAILGTISIEILSNTYKNYVRSKELNKLAQKTDLVLNVIAAKLQNRIKNSVIAVECNSTQTNNSANDSCLNYKNKHFLPLSLVPQNEGNKYPVLEWLYLSNYSKRGIWNASKNNIQPGWSSFVDLKKTYQYGTGDEYNITTPDSNFSIVQEIDGNWSQSWGINGYNNVFENNITALVFGGSDGRGDLQDINNSYGYYDNSAIRVFGIVDTSEYTDKNDSVTIAHIKAINESNSTTVYELYYLVRGAMAIVPVYDTQSEDYNLTLRFNYFPWKKSTNSNRISADTSSSNPHQMYMEGNSSLLVTHVVKFRFYEQGGVIRVYLCVASDVTLDNKKIILCKEKVVF